MHLNMGAIVAPATPAQKANAALKQLAIEEIAKRLAGEVKLGRNTMLATGRRQNVYPLSSYMSDCGEQLGRLLFDACRAALNNESDYAAQTLREFTDALCTDLATDQVNA